MRPELLSQRTAPSRRSLSRSYSQVRDFTERLTRPLEPEDCVLQSMPDVSPTRWHLAHTTWFFEAFVLARANPRYQPVAPEYHHLFNSYYRSVGDPYPRDQRGMLSRPTVREVLAYRKEVDARVRALLESENDDEELRVILELGLHHEQQHQELIVTDIKHVLSINPLHPAYRARGPRSPAREIEMQWAAFDEGLRWIGKSDDGFGYDNESPRHRVWVDEFELATRPVSNGEYRTFLEDGGYRQPALWLDDGWTGIKDAGWEAPLYWVQRDGEWHEFSLDGLHPLDPHEPVCHISYFEADAFARWSGARLPTEFEWEVAAEAAAVAGNFIESGNLHPRPHPRDGHQTRLKQMFGDVWEWTASPYAAYPGYRALEGALGEYNGKFMCNQFVVRGGSCATPQSHMRPTYRSFFHPSAQWQFTGVRLAR